RGAAGTGDPAGATRERDHALVRRAQEGEEAAFAELVALYEKRAWRVARNMVPGDEDARDLVQEAFLRVFRNLDRFDYKHAFSTWLYRIVSNLSIDHLRRRRRTQSTSPVDEDEAGIDLIDEDAPAPSAALESSETQDEVRACLESLAPHFQSVLVLRELEGLPCTEIAEIVGATHVTVRWRLHRGRKLFQEEWERRARLRDSSRTRGIADPSASPFEPARDEERPDSFPSESTGECED
ncbi:MAG: sigma-70 family RNA polymerase sigma factor, partial [Planctomycetes bacterium]|nr:sigma-70 family RNA polymerase sigma factor [Planctomycetota bacterium]